MKLLPHNGLFIRRNNAFGTKMTTGIEELIAQGVMIEHIKIRFDDFIAMNTDGIPSPRRNNALAVSHGIATIPANKKRDNRATHYLEIALKTSEVAALGHPESKAPPVNYVFVVDTSGSMRGEKLETVKTSIRELFTKLRADDVLGVIAFNDQAKTVLEATRVKRLDRYQFGRVINDLSADGGTDINLGLSFGIDEISRHGSRHKVNQVFLFSDGNPTSGETNWIKIRQNIAEKTRDNISLSTFAFGNDASKTELDRLAGITGGQNIFVMEPEDVHITLKREIDRRKHLAAINVQMQIEIDPEIDILHLYGHDLITDPIRRAAVLREVETTKEEIKQDYGVEQQPDIITDEKGIRIFVPNLAVGETYWVVFELAVPNKQRHSTVGKATVQYLDTFARENEKYRFNLSLKGNIAPKWVTQHALGLWTSEVAFYALDDLYENDLDTAEKRLQAHISVLETAKNNFPLIKGDVVTLKKLGSLARNLGKRGSRTDYPQRSSKGVRDYIYYGLNDFGRVRNGFVQRVGYWP
ncbi:MAG: VWA domain-containing protein [Candidatus Parabeggiatoa sp.]|nr:VWA domain-containing protein [Candidatus Parabeggiatoa sp.]